jgi:hypothetical protein
VFSIVRLLISNRVAARAAKTVAVGVSLRERYFRSKTPSAITVGAEVNFWYTDGIGATMFYKTLLPAIAAVAAGQQTCADVHESFSDNS